MCYIEVEVVFDWSTKSVAIPYKVWEWLEKPYDVKHPINTYSFYADHLQDLLKTVKFSECGMSSSTLEETTYMYFIRLLNDCEGNTFRTGISEKGRKNSH